MTTLDVYKSWLGIPDGPRPPGLYELLRLVEFEDDAEKIRANYKKLNAHVRKYASGQYSVRSQELLNELAKAMLCLTDPERKQEYDESRGRVVQDAGQQSGRRTMGKILVDRKVITPAQLKEADSYAEARGLSERDSIVQMKFCDAATAAQALAEELGRPFVDLSDVIPDDSVLDVVPRSTVKRYACLPLFIDEEKVLVACVDEPDPELEEEIRLRYDMSMRAVIATPLSINQGIAKYYAAGMRDEAAADEALKKGAGNAGKSAMTKSKKTGKKTSTVRKRFKDLTPEEQHERRQLGYVIMCWATIGSVLVDQFVLKGHLFPYTHFLKGSLSFFPLDQFFLTLFLPAIGIWWVITEYWK
jgi:Type II secretion system (T2SS), protein E, N-terminal domain